MAILVNMGQRGFILKEGLLNPGQSITVDAETAETLSRAYPKELKVIVPEKVVVPAEVKAEPVSEEKEEIKPAKEEIAKPKAKRKYTRKAK